MNRNLRYNTPADARVELMGWEEIPIVYIDNFYTKIQIWLGSLQ